MAVICKWLKKEKQLPINLSDLRGDTPDQFKLYCKLAGLDLPFNTRLWQEIKHYSKVRNCIVHENGLVKSFQNDKAFMDYVTRKGITSQDTLDKMRSEIPRVLQEHVERSARKYTKPDGTFEGSIALEFSERWAQYKQERFDFYLKLMTDLVKAEMESSSRNAR